VYAAARKINAPADSVIEVDSPVGPALMPA
jgi:hypothetical protein